MPIRQTYFRWSVVVVLLLLWLGFAAWQWHELGHERQQAADSLERQCKTAHHLLVSSIVSHRRMGPAFDAMAQGSLEEIVKSKEILAVGIADLGMDEENSRQALLAAGDTATLDPGQPIDEMRYRWTGSFALSSDFGSGGGGGGHGGGGGGGLGGGGGFGRGRGRVPLEAETETSRFQPGHSYSTTFVLDRSDVDQRLRKASWLRVWLVVTAGLILLLLAIAWLVTVQLVETRGRERILQSEADHLREMGQAAAGLAHETRNPLGLVRGWTQRLAQAATSSPEQQQQAQAVIEECDRVTARINQFLSFAKPCHPHQEKVDLRDLVAELTVILEPDLEAKQLKIERPSDEPPAAYVSVDREMFRQALFNLVSNAIAFSPSEGVIEIATSTGHDGKGRFEIADRGPGVAPDHVNSLFSPYFTTRDGGTGLGLAIVRRIARAHGWHVGFQPRLGGGSIFWLDETDD
jgi:two-component system, NtrC family, sensor histidine kinase HydH